MATTKPVPVFEVIFKAPGLYPWKIPVNKIADTLSAINRLAGGVLVGEEDVEDEEKKEAGGEEVGLVDIQKGSAIFRFIGPHPHNAIERLKETGRVLKNPDTAGKS